MTRGFYPPLLLILILSAILGCEAENPETLVLHDLILVDGTGGVPSQGFSIIVEGERILQIVEAENLVVEPGMEVLDYSGKYAVPGFIDLHVHLPPDKQVQQEICKMLLEFGITTFLNPGARPGAGVVVRDRISKNEFTAPDMLTAGRIIDHNPAFEDMKSWVAQVDHPYSMKIEINRQFQQEVDFIKLYSQLPPDLVDVAITEAHKFGLPVIGHMGATTWGEAAEFGIDMLVHSGWGTPMDEIVELDDPDSADDEQWYLSYYNAINGDKFNNLVELLIKNRVVIVPTLSITQASGLGKDDSLIENFNAYMAPDSHLPDWWSVGWQEKHPQYSPDSELEAKMMQKVYFPAVLRVLNEYYHRGVEIGVGTDVGNSWMTAGFVYHYELLLYQESGIPPKEIIKMATYNGAKALGRLEDTGTVEAGKFANIIILNEDPTIDIKNTQHIHEVYFRGKRVKQN